MPYWLAVVGLVCDVLAVVLPLPLVLLGRARWWNWVGIACASVSAAMLAPRVLGWVG